MTATRIPDSIELDVIGVPQPKGSKSAIVRGNKAVVVEGKSSEARRKQHQWIGDVRAAAQAWRAENPGELLDVPIGLHLHFYLPRPKSAPKRIVHPAKKPDWDKLSRLVCDALTGVIYVDDARIVWATVIKSFAVNRAPGCVVTIWPVG